MSVLVGGMVETIKAALVSTMLQAETKWFVHCNQRATMCKGKNV